MKIIPKIEDLLKIIRTGADLKENEWSLMKYDIAEIDDINTAEIVFKNKKTKKDLVFKFKNGYIYCDELNPKMKQNLISEYLKIYNNNALLEINKKIDSAKESVISLIFENIYNSQYLTNEQVGLDINLMKQILNIGSQNSSFVVLKTGNQVDIKNVNRGDIFTVENTIVVGQNSFAKNRPYLIFGKDEKAGMVYGTFLSTSSNDTKYHKKELNIKSFDKEYLNETGATNTYLIFDLYQPLSSDRLIKKVGQLDQVETLTCLKEILEFHKNQSLDTTFTEIIKQDNETQSKSEELINDKNSEILDEKREELNYSEEPTYEIDDNHDWAREHINNTHKYYTSNGSFNCEFKEVALDKDLEEELKQIVIDYCKKEKIKIANNANGIVFQESCDFYGQVEGYKIYVNKNSKNVKSFPSKTFTLDSFAVKIGEYKKFTNYELTKKLRQLQQKKNPYYYIYLTNYLFYVADKNARYETNDFLAKNGIKYNNVFSGIKNLSVEDIYFDRNYFYEDEKLNQNENE